MTELPGLKSMFTQFYYCHSTTRLVIPTTINGNGQTDVFSQFKVDSICLPMFPHCGSFFSIGPRRPLPYAKFKGTRPQRGACHANRSIDRLPGVPLIVIANSQILQAISFFVHSLEAPEGLYVRNSDARSKGLHWQVPFSLTLVPLSLAYGSA